MSVGFDGIESVIEICSTDDDFVCLVAEDFTFAIPRKENVLTATQSWQYGGFEFVAQKLSTRSALEGRLLITSSMKDTPVASFIYDYGTGVEVIAFLTERTIRTYARPIRGVGYESVWVVSGRGFGGTPTP